MLKKYKSLWVPCLIGCIVFIFITGGKILWPSNINWLLLNVDTADGLYAWQFFRNTPIFQNPIGSNFPYGMGMGGSIIYAEPLFILAFPFKLLSSILPTPFQYQGLWILICFILQAIFSWKLLEKFTKSVLIRIFGCLFFVLAPPFIWRLHSSVSFFSQWLILAAIFFYFSSTYKKYSWIILLIISSLVHAYFLFMLLTIWGADLLNRWLFNELTLSELLKFIFLNFFILLLVIWQAGYFGLHSGFESGGLGYFRINFLSFIDPTDGLGFHSWSHILKNQPKITGEIYEGFTYLGLGMIILGLFGLPKLINPQCVKSNFFSKKSICLIFVSLLLLIYALSNRVALGQHELFNYNLPEIFNIFRASGRLALPFYYLIYLGILYLIIKCNNKSTAIILIFVCLFFQILDSFSTFTNFRNLLINAPSYTSSLKSSIWLESKKKYKKIICIFPVFDWNLFPLIHFAAFNNLSINVGYFARVDNDRLNQIKQQLVKNLLQGKFDNDAIYIIQNQAIRNLIIHRKTNFLYKLIKSDGFYLLLPKMGNASNEQKRKWSASKEKTYKFGTYIFFGKTINSNYNDYLVLVNGWSLPEGKGIWTEGKNSNFIINLPEKNDSNILLTLDAVPFLCFKHPKLTVDVFVNHKFLHHLKYTLNNKNFIKKIEIPNEFFKNDTVLDIEFLFKDPISPNQVFKSQDIRKLGFFVSSISFDLIKK